MLTPDRNKYLVVGAGFSGAVIARTLAEQTLRKVLVVDERHHVAGNCHTARDPETGVMVHTYGPHIFHTDREDVWKYVNGFVPFMPYTHRVKAHTGRGMFSLPINLHTINQFFGLKLNPSEAKAFLQSRGDHTIGEPRNFEEQALKFLGEELYRTFFYGYTKKQWGCEPNLLPASILQRLPVRFNYDDSYHGSPFQGIPRDGYSAVIQGILDHPNIEILLGTRVDRGVLPDFRHVFWSGPLDAYFGYSLGRLGYRTSSFEREVAEGDFQGATQINYTEMDTAFTRIHEHKHFTPWEQHARTVYFTEYSKETEDLDVPYYPKRLAGDMERLLKYRALAEEEANVSFVGRLATYRYMDMHRVIGEALDFSRDFLAVEAAGQTTFPKFPNAVA
jgi:UDP-galactopyranose mutase